MLDELCVSMIVAYAHNRVIGKDNKLLWHLSPDLKRFKSLTLGKPIIMGRKTFESIGRPLPGRHSIVLTRDKDWQHDGVEIVRDLNAALAAAKRYCSAHSVEEIMVIGGESVYRQALPIAKRIYATEVELTLEGDAWFPEVTGDWRLLQLEAGAFEGVKFSFQTLELNE